MSARPKCESYSLANLPGLRFCDKHTATEVGVLKLATEMGDAMNATLAADLAKARDRIDELAGAMRRALVRAADPTPEPSSTTLDDVLAILRAELEAAP